ncbi:hypothetical protein A1O3_01277 [Capronia epimyces CBS 606.96]|uniref:CENP-V/GFA domain-containing protein n=1 Tax=Capronia epimyces CBS 606.96 TaxID=1182542 RepID=W9YSS3_9EURO|nr:uncharacterized protein A1O3_01277 [Capronia epimyces CBS 606.96]EXJ92725.1 hypothetical protein A1O3_01277 [Capronia epimyces CBS 606.96]
MIKGSCACGRVQYQTQSQPRTVTACHCGTCQKAGGPFLAFAGFPTSELQWIHQPDLWARSDFADRGYCKVCGSSVSMRYYVEDITYVTLGTIEPGTALPRIGAHIFLKEKAPWVVLPDDGAERWDGFGPGFEKELAQWRRQRLRPKL